MIGPSTLRSEQFETGDTARPRWASTGQRSLLVFVVVLAATLATLVVLPQLRPMPVQVTAAEIDASYRTTGTAVVHVAEPIVTETTIKTAAATPPSLALWPPRAQGHRFADPRELALEFASLYIGFTDPHIGRYEPTGRQDGVVVVRPTRDGPATEILVYEVVADGSWWVLGASTANIVVDQPMANARIDDPVRIVGEALVEAGILEVEIRSRSITEALLRFDFVTGGGDEPQWFEGQFGGAVADEEAGAVVFLIRSPDDGRILEAAVVPVRLPTSNR